jgi:transcriptional regulator with XRE-family HTH domain
MSRVGYSIKLVREARGYSLSKLAGLARISVPYLSLIESGDREPPDDTLRRLASALKVDSRLLKPTTEDGRGRARSLEGLSASLQRLADATEKFRKLLGE